MYVIKRAPKGFGFNMKSNTVTFRQVNFRQVAGIEIHYTSFKNSPFVTSMIGGSTRNFADGRWMSPT